MKKIPERPGKRSFWQTTSSPSQRPARPTLPDLPPRRGWENPYTLSYRLSIQRKRIGSGSVPTFPHFTTEERKRETLQRSTAKVDSRQRMHTGLSCPVTELDDLFNPDVPPKPALLNRLYDNRGDFFVLSAISAYLVRRANRWGVIITGNDWEPPRMKATQLTVKAMLHFRGHRLSFCFFPICFCALD